MKNQPYPNKIQELEQYKCIVDRLYQYAQSGTYLILPQYTDANRKHNHIITKFDSLKNTNYSKIVHDLLTSLSFNEQDQTLIKKTFSSSVSNVIIYRLKIIHQESNLMEKILSIMRQANTDIRSHSFTSKHTIIDQLNQFINRMKISLEALKLTAEYPSQVNLNAISKLIKQNTLGSILKADLEKIVYLKKGIKDIEDKLKDFSYPKYSNGTIDQNISNKIRNPCDFLIYNFRQASSFMEKYCTENTLRPPLNSSKYSLIENIDFITEQQKAVKDSIVKINVKVEENLNKTGLCFQNSDYSRIASVDLTTLLSKIELASQFMMELTWFIEKISAIMVQENPASLFSLNTNVNSYIAYPRDISIFKDRWKNKLDNLLKLAKSPKISASNNFYGCKSPTQYNKHLNQAIFFGLNPIQTPQKLNLRAQNKILSHRWITIYQLISGHSYCKQKQSLLPLNNEDIVLLQVCKQINSLKQLKRAIQNSIKKSMDEQNRKIIVKQENQQFKNQYGDLKEQFYGFQEKIHKLSISHIQLNQYIAKCERQIQSLSQYKQLYNKSQQVISQIIQKIQQVAQVFHLKYQSVSSSRQEIISMLLNLIIEKKLKQNQQAQRALTQKSSFISELKSRLNQQKNYQTKRQFFFQNQLKRKEDQKNYAIDRLQEQNEWYRGQNQSLSNNRQEQQNQLSRLNNQLASISDLNNKLKEGIRLKDQQILMKKDHQTNIQTGIDSISLGIRQQYSAAAQLYHQKAIQIFNQFSEEIIQIKEKILSNVIQKVQQGISKYSHVIKKMEQLKIHADKLNRVKHCFKNQLNQLKIQNQNQKNLTFQLRQQIKNIQASSIEANKSWKKKYDEIIKINEGLKQQKIRLDDEVRKKRREIKDLQSTIDTLQSDLNNQKILIASLKLQLQLLPNNNEVASNSNSTQFSKTSNSNQISQLKFELTNLKASLSSKEYQITILNKNLSQEKNLTKKLEQQCKLSKDQAIKHKNMIEDIKSNNRLMKTPNKGAINQNQIKETVRKQLQQTIQRQFQAHKKKLRQLYMQKYVSKYNQMNQKELNEVYLAYLDKLFQGQLFQSQITMKHRLVTHLQRFTNRFIAKTRIVYKLDLKNKTNFHQYIDKTSNLLCLIKTISGTYLAGYYTGTYLSESMTQPGLLISITNNDSYQLNVPDNQTKTNYRAMVYDLYFLIFGNAQLRIKTGEKALFSNFGIMNSYFNARGKKLADFIGPENKRDVDIQSYEIYEVIYESFNYQS